MSRSLGAIYTGNQHTSVILLMAHVANPRKPFILNPANMTLISEIPEPAADFAKDLTKWAAVNENPACRDIINIWVAEKRVAYSKQDINYPPRYGHFTPRMPWFANSFVSLYFPTTKVLVKPPTIRAVPHFDVWQPFGNDRNEGCVNPDTYS